MTPTEIRALAEKTLSLVQSGHIGPWSAEAIIARAYLTLTAPQAGGMTLTEELSEIIKSSWVHETHAYGCRYCDAPPVANMSAEIKHTVDCILKKIDRFIAPPAQVAETPFHELMRKPVSDVRGFVDESNRKVADKMASDSWKASLVKPTPAEPAADAEVRDAYWMSDAAKFQDRRLRVPPPTPTHERRKAERRNGDSHEYAMKSDGPLRRFNPRRAVDKARAAQ